MRSYTSTKNEGVKKGMSEEVRKAIMKANAKLTSEVRKGNAAGAAALYTEDAILLPPNSERVQGRKGIETFWAGTITQLGLKDGILTTEELIGSGDTYTEIGSYTMKIQPPGQKLLEDKGKYSVVWKMTADGWKLHRDMWNSSLPPPK